MCYGLELSVELFEGEFVRIIHFLFDTVHDTFHLVKCQGRPFCMEVKCTVFNSVLRCCIGGAYDVVLSCKGSNDDVFGR